LKEYLTGGLGQGKGSDIDLDISIYHDKLIYISTGDKTCLG
jgi:hypothetical protein